MTDYTKLLKQIHKAGEELSDSRMEDLTMDDLIEMGLNDGSGYIEVETKFSRCDVYINKDNTASEISCYYREQEPDYYFSDDE